MLRELCPLLIVISTKILSCNGWRPYDIKLSNLICQSFNENIDATFTLNNSAIDASLNLKEPFNNLFSHVEVLVDSGNGNYDMELYNKTLNVCKFFHNKRYEPLWQIFYKVALKYGQFPTKCPIRKASYTLRQFRPSVETLPPGFPEMKAFLSMKYYRKNDRSMELLGVFSVFARTIKKYKS